MIDLTRRAPTVLHTHRLTIMRASPSDAGDLHAAARASVGEVWPWLPWCHPDYTIEEAREWLALAEPEWRDGNSFTFIVRDRHNQEFLGGCGLRPIDEHPVANLGYWTKTGATTRGVASEAAAAVARFGIEQLDFIRIEIIMSVHNFASRRVAEKAGGVYEGRLRNRLLLHGNPHDTFVYSIIKL